MRFARLAFALVLPLAACGEDPKDNGVTGVYDATIAQQAGNSSTIRYWFASDGSWGRARQDVIGGTSTVTCDTPSAKATYELRGGELVLRFGTSESTRTWKLSADETTLTLTPPDRFGNGTEASVFTRVKGAQTNRDCNSAF